MKIVRLRLLLLVLFAGLITPTLAQQADADVWSCYLAPGIYNVRDGNTNNHSVIDGSPAEGEWLVSGTVSGREGDTLKWYQVFRTEFNVSRQGIEESVFAVGYVREDVVKLAEGSSGCDDPFVWSEQSFDARPFTVRLDGSVRYQTILYTGAEYREIAFDVRLALAETGPVLVIDKLNALYADLNSVFDGADICMPVIQPSYELEENHLYAHIVVQNVETATFQLMRKADCIATPVPLPDLSGLPTVSLTASDWFNVEPGPDGGYSRETWLYQLTDSLAARYPFAAGLLLESDGLVPLWFGTPLTERRTPLTAPSVRQCVGGAQGAAVAGMHVEDMLWIISGGCD